MRVNILLDDPKGVRADWFNADPFAPDDDPHGRTRCSPAPHGDDPGLARFVGAAEALEVSAREVLDAWDLSSVPAVLSHWAGRLRRGGLLFVSFHDARSVARRLLADEMSLEEANGVLHGRRRSSLTWRHVNDLLRGMGLDTARAGNEGTLAWMEMKRK